MPLATLHLLLRTRPPSSCTLSNWTSHARQAQTFPLHAYNNLSPVRTGDFLPRKARQLSSAAFLPVRTYHHCLGVLWPSRTVPQHVEWISSSIHSQPRCRNWIRHFASRISEHSMHTS